MRSAALRFHYQDVPTTGSRDLQGKMFRRLLAAAYAAAAYVAVATTFAGAVLPPGDPCAYAFALATAAKVEAAVVPHPGDPRLR